MLRSLNILGVLVCLSWAGCASQTTSEEEDVALYEEALGRGGRPCTSEGRACPNDQICIDNPTDACDPASGDCPGVCH